MTTQAKKNLDRALGLAAELQAVAKREGANHARCLELAETIDALVGRRAGNKWVWPLAVRVAAGQARPVTYTSHKSF